MMAHDGLIAVNHGLMRVMDSVWLRMVNDGECRFIILIYNKQ